MVTRVRDRYGNQIELTDERWRHIVIYHPELEEFREDVLETFGREQGDKMHQSQTSTNM